jgi:hypothetical protein
VPLSCFFFDLDACGAGGINQMDNYIIHPLLFTTSVPPPTTADVSLYLALQAADQITHRGAPVWKK